MMKVLYRIWEQGHERRMIPSSPFLVSFFLLVSVPVLFVLAPRILPPKTLPSIPDRDEIDDLALFRRATLASADGGGGGGLRRRATSPPKIAFMFLTNSDLSFAPLWERFFRGHERLFNVYIHADPSSRLLLTPTPSFRDRFIPAKATQRGSPTLISAARRLLAAALVDDPANAFFALISQHCIPLHSFRFTYHAVLSDPGTLKPANAEGVLRRRHLSFIEILSGEPGLWNRYVARGDDVMLPEVSFDQFRVGSQFFILARRHALMIVRDRRLWKKFKMPCLKSREDSCYPEEHYFPTLLGMQDPEGCTRYTLTRVNWTDSVGGHPHTYRPLEISGDLIKLLRKSNSTYSYLFARKFSPHCLQPLLKLCDSVIFRD
ncbi:glycosyltransferase BC10-like [Zingiber officinale]|uniref:glycosyltransferase BC10-like n=1 Tax=Zingiber officinale TaxID=94328 RepID=UPI001C4AD4BC|nr:glycosyltransferase BC10-like [Zingiber officinale]